MNIVQHKDENIGNHRYISTWILWIYRIYQGNTGGYFDTKLLFKNIDNFIYDFIFVLYLISIQNRL